MQYLKVQAGPQQAVELVAPDDKKLETAITRMLRTKSAGLTVEMVGADFLARRIAPLQDSQNFAWEYDNTVDMMRERLGIHDNLILLQLSILCHQLRRQKV